MRSIATASAWPTRAPTSFLVLSADLVLVVSADQLYTLDFRDITATHLAADAELTMVTTRVDSDVLASLIGADGLIAECQPFDTDAPLPRGFGGA